VAWLGAPVLVATIASADPGVVVAPATSPPVVDARTRTEFRQQVKADVASDPAAAHLDGYTVQPKILELRSYQENDAKTPTVVCVVDLILTTSNGALAARARGTARSAAASPREVLDIATHAATTRLSAALAALARRPDDKVVSR
jgi:hypothetical protein